MSTKKFTGLTFDASTVKPQVPLEAFPAGNYLVALTDAEVKPTSKGDGKRIAFELTVLDGAFKGRKVWDGLNIENKNSVAQEIAHQQLSAICHATGVIRLTDVQELYGKPFEAKIGFQEAEGEYDAKNTFKGAKPAAGGSGAAPAAVGAPAAPKWAKKAADAPAAAPAAAAPASAPPAKPAGPKGPPKPTAPAKAKEDHKFFAYVNDETQGPLPADEALALPADTMLCLEGTDDWKPVSEFKPAPAPAPVVAPAGKTPPWAKKA